ncbi:MAG: phosphoribosylamine--glycine ligase [Firmicutes bacterium]|nr:phosphoribosylamine--glycine ligase [Bacillota bacterium]
MNKKNILVVGSGGREHAIIHTLKKSDKVGKIYACPGNAGISELAECINILATDINGIVEFVKNHPDIYMTVIGPDDSLALGLTDLLLSKTHCKRVFGPSQAAAIIESSKAFSKDFMKKYNIPTAAYEIFSDYEKAKKYLANISFPTVIKADGLALGKGVFICEDFYQAESALKEIMQDKKFGAAGARVVIEEYLKGFELTVLSFTDGESLIPMVTSRDYKRAYDGDKGLNTGGMGCFSPHPLFNDGLMKEALDEVFMPTIRGMKKEGRLFQGCLYFTLMVDVQKKGRAKFNIIEYNARFGDPETQVVLPRLKTDLFEIFEAIVDGELHKMEIEWDNECSVCVIAASNGYPLDYEKGKEIGIGELNKDTLLFEAGTKFALSGKKVTNGGRVLGVVCKGVDIGEARDKAYQEIKKIEFEGIFYRQDIAKDF